MDIILKGLLTGVLSAYLIIYGLRPSQPYPDFILDIFEHKWFIIILFILSYYLIIWDYRIGVLFLLSNIALISDYMIFIKSDLKKSIVYTNTNNNRGLDEILLEKLK